MFGQDSLIAFAISGVTGQFNVNLHNVLLNKELITSPVISKLYSLSHNFNSLRCNFFVNKYRLQLSNSSSSKRSNFDMNDKSMSRKSIQQNVSSFKVSDRNSMAYITFLSSSFILSGDKVN